MWMLMKFFAYSIPALGYLMDLAKVPMVYQRESQFFIDTVSQGGDSVVKKFCLSFGLKMD